MFEIPTTNFKFEVGILELAKMPNFVEKGLRH